MKEKKQLRLPVDEKYKLYELAVQSPEADVEFFQKVYAEMGGRKNSELLLREDFCGTFKVCCEWVKLHKGYKAIGIDLDPEPLDYGFRKYYSKLKPEQQKRVQVLTANVLDPLATKSDITVAANFSYYLFHHRQDLLSYFRRAFKGIKPGGIFIIDAFGGKLCHGPYVDRLPNKGFTYYWDQKGHDPVTHKALFSIHFKLKNRIYKDVFTYDWRLWGIAELREILIDAGFESTHVYWEGSTRSGKGNGIFSKTDVGEECLSWVSYIAAKKPN